MGGKSFHISSKDQIHFIVGKFKDYLKFHDLIMQKEENVFVTAFTSILSRQV